MERKIVKVCSRCNAAVHVEPDVMICPRRSCRGQLVETHISALLANSVADVRSVPGRRRNTAEPAPEPES